MSKLINNPYNMGIYFIFESNKILDKKNMTRILTVLFTALTALSFAQPAAYKPTSPQVVYEMYVECVEPIHKAYHKMSLSSNKPSMTAAKLKTMVKESVNKLETFHKERLHRDSYTAAKTYLDGIKDVNVSVILVLESIESADPSVDISQWLEDLHDATIREKPLADTYRESILKVIDLFKDEWDNWLEAEVIYFSRDGENELVGINKSASGSINIQISDNTIDEIRLLNQVTGKIYPESLFPENTRKLRNFDCKIRVRRGR